MAQSRLHELSALGQSVWIDTITRDWLLDGTLERLIEEDAVVGVTSNPTIFQKALSSGSAYDEQMRECMARLDDPKDVFYELAVKDIQDACDVLRAVWDGGGGEDGYVSMEVDPTLAYDREGTTEEALRLHEWIDRPNLFVKIPATKPGLGSIEDCIAGGHSINVTLIFSLEVDPTLAYDRDATFEQAMRFHREVDRRNLYVKIPGTEPGLGAIENCIAEGRSINVTLIFSLARHKEVMEAYLRGLERLAEAGGDAGSVISVASFFVSRVDTEADGRLDQVGRPDLKGRLAVANAKLAYENWKQAFSGERWAALEARGARTQRCLWASTSTKNPEYRDVLYVEELIGRDVVNTMPAETIKAFQDHGEVRDTLETGLDEARALLGELAAAGVDYDDVVETLEQEGVKKFSDSFAELLDGIRAKAGAVASR